MSAFFLLAGAVPLALFLVYFAWSVRREERRTAAILERMKADPGSVTEVRLHDNDPISVEVRFAGEELCWLSDIHGVQAVRKFDDLKAELPCARFTVFLNGRETQFAR